MRKFRNKPVTIEAVQFNGFKKENGQVDLSERPEWLTNEFGKKVVFFDKINTLTIKTLEGSMTANLGDWIIKGVNGELYPCKPDIFKKFYEEVHDSFIHRIIEERNQLIEKTNKLDSFIKTDKFKSLDLEMQRLMSEQCDVMHKYNSILVERIIILTPKDACCAG